MIFEEKQLQKFEIFNLVLIYTAMPRGRSHTAGTNRSGAKRKRAMSENNTADGPEAGSSLGVRPLEEKQVGSIEHLESDKEIDKTGSEEDRSLVIEEGDRENNGKEIVYLNPYQL